MNFQLRQRQENGFDLVGMADSHNGTEVWLLPGYGAILHAFTVRTADGSMVDVIDSYKDLAELKKGLSHSFKGPKLSPFPCRIRNGKYRFEGMEYSFSRLFADGSAIHGLLYDRPFSVVETTAEERVATVALEYNYRKDDPGYPFEYACQVRYTLHPDNLLEVATTISNLDQVVMPVADGWHPYFRLGGRIDDWRLQFHSAAIVEFDRHLIPTGKLLQYDRFAMAHPIGDVVLDNCFSLKPDLVSAACEIHNPANGVSVAFYPDARYPYLQVYTPPARTSIAVENLSGAPDCFNNNMGLTLLEPGHAQIFTVRYQVSG